MAPSFPPVGAFDRRGTSFKGWPAASQNALMNSVALGTAMAAASTGAMMGLGWAMAGRFALAGMPAPSARRLRAGDAAPQSDTQPIVEAAPAAFETRMEPVSQPVTEEPVGSEKAEASEFASPSKETGGISPERPTTLLFEDVSRAFDADREASAPDLAAAPLPADPIQEAVSALASDAPFAPDANMPSIDALLSSAAAPPTLTIDSQRPSGLDAPRGGVADDLKRIVGIGPKLERMLNELGIHHFDQIAGWSDDEVAWINRHLRRNVRAERDTWRAQAEALLASSER